METLVLCVTTFLMSRENLRNKGDVMSQKKEKYAREMGRIQRVHSVKLDSLGERVQQIETREWQWLDLVASDKKAVNQLSERVARLELDHRKKEVSRERIALLSSTAVVCAALMWISLKIFGMV